MKWKFVKQFGDQRLYISFSNEVMVTTLNKRNKEVQVPITVEIKDYILKLNLPSKILDAVVAA